MGNSMFETYNFVIPDAKSYWATHFYSILQCLDKHKNFEYSPQRIHSWPVWSMGQLRGEFVLEFFHHIERYMRNWGLQYFLCNLFNQKIGMGIIDRILHDLEQMYSYKIMGEFDRFKFYVSGKDSRLSENLLSMKCRPEVFPESGEEGSAGDSFEELVERSDLCLILEGSMTGRSIAIFGEVEGNKGKKTTSDRFWLKKPEFCVFSIGVVPGPGRGIYFDYKQEKKCVILIEGKNPVVEDFSVALNFFTNLFRSGPCDRSIGLLARDEEFNFFAEKMKKLWWEPIQVVYLFIEQYIDKGDLVGVNPDFAPIITDLQA